MVVLSLFSLLVLFHNFYLAHLSWALKWGLVITSCLFLSVCKLFNFSSASPELLGQFQTNYETAKIHKQNLKIISRTTGQISTKLSPKHLLIPSNKESHFLPRGDNNEIGKIHWRHFKNFFSRITWPISTKLDIKYPWLKGTKVVQILKRRDITGEVLSYSTLKYNHTFAQMYLLIGNGFSGEQCGTWVFCYLWKLKRGRC